ncbi:MAG: hypothetical protein PETM_01557 [Petrimonas sp.]
MHTKFLVHDLNGLILLFPSSNVQYEFRKDSLRTNYAVYTS